MLPLIGGKAAGVIFARVGENDRAGTIDHRPQSPTIKRRRDIRGRDHVLSLNAAPLSEAADWISHYQRFWGDSLAALDEFATGKKSRPRKQK